MQGLTASDPREIAGYELMGRLGAGGMGVVYLSHTPGGQPVALKVIRREYVENPDFRRRFAREVAAARRVHGPYTAPVLDSDTECPQPWLATAYVAGPSLADAVRAHGSLPPRTVLSLVAGTAEALEAVHAAGLVHRDLKPTNVLLASNGPRVIDFGLVRATDATALTGTDVRLGTPAYMAPEQVTGTTAGPEIDVFALGMVAFFAATARHPFGDGSAYALLFRIVSEEPDLASCPEQLRNVVGHCLAKTPEQRPSPAEVIEMCRGSGDGASFHRGPDWWLPENVGAEVNQRESAQPSAQPVSRPEVQQSGQASATDGERRGAHRPRMVIAAAGLAAVLAAGGATYWATHSPRVGESSDGGRNQPSNQAGWKQMVSDKPINLRAPLPTSDTSAHCSAARATFVDLNSMSVETHQTHAGLSSEETLVYMNCGENDEFPDNGLRLVDGKGVWGSVNKREITPQECRTAARRNDLPGLVTIQQIKKGSVLKAGMGICVETDQKNVVLLWIDRVAQNAGKDGTRSYFSKATQWTPEKT
ncbi:serine/threonine-protein kinase [Streptomyces sp. 3N207]|uniref:serine/threonine-protein kinase n=1 Tax=Streptomyces sp. 3N207 TaxID=3457417 RepID=UPI003FD118D7